MFTKIYSISISSLIDEGFITLTNFRTLPNGNHSWDTVIAKPYDKYIKTETRLDGNGDKRFYLVGFNQAFCVRAWHLAKMGVKHG